ncbi:MAG: hypothetical protein IJV48_06265 [Ruminococcus sp.]|nr:hypothetical protein [Ruminococcus sp.]
MAGIEGDRSAIRCITAAKTIRRFDVGGFCALDSDDLNGYKIWRPLFGEMRLFMSYMLEQIDCIMKSSVTVLKFF